MLFRSAPASWIWIRFSFNSCLCVWSPTSKAGVLSPLQIPLPLPQGMPGVPSTARWAGRRHRRCPSSPFPRARASPRCPPDLDRASPLLPIPSRPALAACACRLVAPPGSLPAARLPAYWGVVFLLVGESSQYSRNLALEHVRAVCAGVYRNGALGHTRVMDSAAGHLVKKSQPPAPAGLTNTVFF